MVFGAFNQSRRTGGTVLGKDLLFQGTAVDADSDGYAMAAAGLRHLFNPGILPDIAGVNPNFVYACRYTVQRQAVVEMDIRHQRNADLLFNRVNQGHRLGVGDGYPHNFTSGRLQLLGLADISRNILCRDIEHGLDADWLPRADGCSSDFH